MHMMETAASPASWKFASVQQRLVIAAMLVQVLSVGHVLSLPTETPCSQCEQCEGAPAAVEGARMHCPPPYCGWCR